MNTTLHFNSLYEFLENTEDIDTDVTGNVVDLGFLCPTLSWGPDCYLTPYGRKKYAAIMDLPCEMDYENALLTVATTNEKQDTLLANFCLMAAGYTSEENYTMCINSKIDEYPGLYP